MSNYEPTEKETCLHCKFELSEEEADKHFCTRCEERGCQEPQDAPEPDPDN